MPLIGTIFPIHPRSKFGISPVFKALIVFSLLIACSVYDFQRRTRYSAISLNISVNIRITIDTLLLVLGVFSTRDSLYYSQFIMHNVPEMKYFLRAAGESTTSGENVWSTFRIRLTTPSQLFFATSRFLPSFLRMSLNSVLKHLHTDKTTSLACPTKCFPAIIGVTISWTFCRICKM